MTTSFTPYSYMAAGFMGGLTTIVTLGVYSVTATLPTNTLEFTTEILQKGTLITLCAFAGMAAHRLANDLIEDYSISKFIVLTTLPYLALPPFFATVFAIGVIADVTVSYLNSSPQIHGGVQGEGTGALSKVTFNDIVPSGDLKQNMENLKRILQDTSGNPLRPPTPKGILFTGPPGTGKTMMAQALANELGHTAFFATTPGELKGAYAGETESRIKEFFAKAQAKQKELQANLSPGEKAYAIIFIDEIDGFGNRGTDRSANGGVDWLTRTAIGAFLSEMEGFRKLENVIVIATTNLLNQVDPALRQRFTHKYLIPLPDAAAREAILRSLLHEIPTEDSLNYSFIVDKTDGKSFREIVALVDQAKTNAYYGGAERLATNHFSVAIRGITQLEQSLRR